MKNLSNFNSAEYDIKDFGAITSDSLQTSAIQKAIDTCFLNGGGKVVVPAGIYRIGCIRLRSNVALYLKSGAILKGSTNPMDYFCYKKDQIEPIREYDPGASRSNYPFAKWHNAVIRVINAENVAIVGEVGSYIDGSNCYDPTGEENYRGPHGISVWYSKNILLDGYTFIDCGNWAHAIFKSQNITAKNLKVYGGHDAFDVRTCDNILVEKCEFCSGDDGIAGFDNCDVEIRDCIFNCACSAMRFGGNNVLVENCKGISPAPFAHRWLLSAEEKRNMMPTNENCRHDMLNVFQYYCDFRADIRKTPGDILIRNCDFVGANRIFDLPFDGEHVWCCNRSLSSIKFENCNFEGIAEPMNIHGDENEPISFTMENSKVSILKGYENKPFIKAVNFSQINLTNVITENLTNPEIQTFSKGEINVKDSSDFKIC